MLVATATHSWYAWKQGKRIAALLAAAAPARSSRQKMQGPTSTHNNSNRGSAAVLTVACEVGRDAGGTTHTSNSVVSLKLHLHTGGPIDCIQLLYLCDSKPVIKPVQAVHGGGAV